MKNKIKNKTKQNNLFVFLTMFFLVGASLSFFVLGEEQDSKSIFEDFDGDGLSNSEEEAFETDPNNADTDGDGYSDGVEVESGYDPLKPASSGDKIVKNEAEKTETNDELVIDEKNLTQKFSKNIVEYMGDAKESGKENVSTEDLDKIVSKSLEEGISAENIEIDPKEFKIKKQDYKNLSEKKRKAKEKEDVIEYFTAVSYVFMTNFPEGFFEQNPEEVVSEILANAQNFSSDLTQTQFFENLAENTIKAESELKNVEVPESLVEIHYQGLYLLGYMKSIYNEKGYKNSEEDALSMLVALTKLQGLIGYSGKFIENVKKVMQEYEIEDQFLNF